MQFLAARSRCTNFISAKYFIPLATSKHILVNIFIFNSYMNVKATVCIMVKITHYSYKDINLINDMDILFMPSKVIFFIFSISNYI